MRKARAYLFKRRTSSKQARGNPCCHMHCATYACTRTLHDFPESNHNFRACSTPWLQCESVPAALQSVVQKTRSPDKRMRPCWAQPIDRLGQPIDGLAQLIDEWAAIAASLPHAVGQFSALHLQRVSFNGSLNLSLACLRA